MSGKLPSIRCPALGHQVEIGYCYKAGEEGLPCRRLLACWEGYVPRLRQVVQRLLTPEQWKRCFESPPRSKLQSLVKAINRAREDGSHEEGD